MEKTAPWIFLIIFLLRTAWKKRWFLFLSAGAGQESSGSGCSGRAFPDDQSLVKKR